MLPCHLSCNINFYFYFYVLFHFSNALSLSLSLFYATHTMLLILSLFRCGRTVLARRLHIHNKVCEFICITLSLLLYFSVLLFSIRIGIIQVNPAYATSTVCVHVCMCMCLCLCMREYSHCKHKMNESTFAYIVYFMYVHIRGKIAKQNFSSCKTGKTPPTVITKTSITAVCSPPLFLIRHSHKHTHEID